MAWNASCNDDEGYAEYNKPLRYANSWTMLVKFDEDVTDIEVAAEIRKQYYEEQPVATAVFTVTKDIESKTFTIILSESESLKLPVGEYLWDAKYTIAANEVAHTFMGGSLTIVPVVTP
jgi:hypothetical protein